MIPLFSLYDVGVHGMLSIVCNLPVCKMIPYNVILAGIKATKEKEDDDR